MKVWILERCLDYEGCYVVGVFATEEAAKKAEALELGGKKKPPVGTSIEINEWEVEK